MNQSRGTCLQCGAELKGAPDPYGIVRCEYCGASNRVDDPRRETARPAQPPQFARPVAVSSTTNGLPPEYARLQRPKPTAPLGSSGCMAIFGLIWTLFSSIFVVAGVGFFFNEQNMYTRLLKEGLPATATITQLEVDDSGDSTSYLVYYQFRAPVNGDLSRFEDHESVSSSFYSSLTVEQQIEILYAASDPSLSAIKAEFGPPSIWFSLVFVGMGGLFVLIGLGLLYGAVRDLYHLNLLHSQGQPARAYVFDRWTDRDSDNDTTYFVAYAFKTPDGRMISRAEQDKNLYQLHQIGEWIEVRYLTDNPSICQKQRDKESNRANKRV
jgi:DNA-directed RNA polymerase subunit RPC12/RpoP